MALRTAKVQDCARNALRKGDCMSYDDWKTTPPDDPEPVMHCDICGEPIYEGDGVTDICGDKWCDECLKERRTIA